MLVANGYDLLTIIFPKAITALVKAASKRTISTSLP